MVASLKRLLPIGLNLFGGREQELVQQCKQKLIEVKLGINKAKELQYIKYIIGLIRQDFPSRWFIPHMMCKTTNVTEVVSCK